MTVFSWVQNGQLNVVGTFCGFAFGLGLFIDFLLPILNDEDFFFAFFFKDNKILAGKANFTLIYPKTEKLKKSKKI